MPNRPLHTCGSLVRCPNLAPAGQGLCTPCQGQAPKHFKEQGGRRYPPNKSGFTQLFQNSRGCVGSGSEPKTVGLTTRYGGKGLAKC